MESTPPNQTRFLFRNPPPSNNNNTDSNSSNVDKRTDLVFHSLSQTFVENPLFSDNAIKHTGELVTHLNALCRANENPSKENLPEKGQQLWEVAVAMIKYFSTSNEPTEDDLRELTVLAECTLAPISLGVIEVLTGTIDKLPFSPYLYTAIRKSIQLAPLDCERTNQLIEKMIGQISKVTINKANRSLLITQFELLAETTNLLSRGVENYSPTHKDALYATMQKYRNHFGGREEVGEANYSTKIHNWFTSETPFNDVELAYLAVCTKEATVLINTNRTNQARLAPFVKDGVKISVGIITSVLTAGSPTAITGTVEAFASAAKHGSELKKTRGKWFLPLLRLEKTIKQLLSSVEKDRIEAKEEIEKEFSESIKYDTSGTNVTQLEQDQNADLIQLDQEDQNQDKYESWDLNEPFDRHHAWYFEYGLARAFGAIVEVSEHKDILDFALNKIFSIYSENKNKANKLSNEFKRSLKKAKSWWKKATHLFNRYKNFDEYSKQKESDIVSYFVHVKEGVWTLLNNLYSKHPNDYVAHRIKNEIFDKEIPVNDPSTPWISQIDKSDKFKEMLKNLEIADRQPVTFSPKTQIELFKNGVKNAYPAEMIFLERRKRQLKYWSNTNANDASLYVPLKGFWDSNTEAQSLQEIVNSCLIKSNRTDHFILIKGPSGCGKTLFAKKSEEYLWSQYDWTNRSYIPLFLSRKESSKFFEDPTSLRRIIEDWQISSDLKVDLNSLEEQGKFVFLVNCFKDLTFDTGFYRDNLEKWSNSRFIFFVNDASQISISCTIRNNISIKPPSFDELKKTYFPKVAQNMPPFWKQDAYITDRLNIDKHWDEPGFYIDHCERLGVTTCFKEVSHFIHSLPYKLLDTNNPIEHTTTLDFITLKSKHPQAYRLLEMFTCISEEFIPADLIDIIREDDQEKNLQRLEVLETYRFLESNSTKDTYHLIYDKSKDREKIQDKGSLIEKFLTLLATNHSKFNSSDRRLKRICLEVLRLCDDYISPQNNKFSVQKELLYRWIIDNTLQEKDSSSSSSLEDNMMIQCFKEDIIKFYLYDVESYIEKLRIMGDLRLKQGRLDAAKDFYDSAKLLAFHNYQPKQSLAKSMNNIGLEYERVKKFSNAREMYDASLEIYKSLIRTVTNKERLEKIIDEYIEILDSYADSLIELDSIDENYIALKLATEALETTRTFFKTNLKNKKIASCCLSLGYAQLRVGSRTEACRLFEEAITLYSSHDPFTKVVKAVIPYYEYDSEQITSLYQKYPNLKNRDETIIAILDDRLEKSPFSDTQKSEYFNLLGEFCLRFKNDCKANKIFTKSEAYKGKNEKNLISFPNG